MPAQLAILTLSTNEVRATVKATSVTRTRPHVEASPLIDFGQKTLRRSLHNHVQRHPPTQACLPLHPACDVTKHVFDLSVKPGRIRMLLLVSQAVCLTKPYIAQAMRLKLATDASIYNVICTDHFDSCVLAVRPLFPRRLQANSRQTMRCLPCLFLPITPFRGSRGLGMIWARS